MGTQHINRRDFLRLAGIGAITLAGRPGLLEPLQVPPQVVSAFTPDAEIEITAVDQTLSILPGAKTRVYHYNSRLVTGSGVTVDPIPGSYLGPIIRVPTGKKLRINFKNKLPEKSIVHPHGPRVPEACDGHPMQAIDPGKTLDYEFEVIDHAAPFWFHPHPMMRTAEQVMMGLAGLLYVTDPDEQAAIPGAASGANDLPLVIQDRSFDANNQFRYQPNMMWGFLGERILINGIPDAAWTLEPRPYRLRLLNGSNARTYKLAWSNNTPLTVIGTDGGLPPKAQSYPYLILAPGQRRDIWIDFSPLAGKQVTLRSLEFDPGGMGMGGMMGGMGGRGGRMGMMGGMGMGGMMGGMGGGIPMGSAFDVLSIQVKKTPAGQSAPAAVLGPLPSISPQYRLADFPNPYTCTLSMGMGMVWTLNGRVFEDAAVAEDEKFPAGEPLAWEWVNASPIPHPMHIHNVQFQVIGRDDSAAAASYAGIRDGLVDDGWQDTVLVWPGERVRTAMSFGPHTGMYMYHCHILEHEDMTMMRNFMITGSDMPNM